MFHVDPASIGSPPPAPAAADGADAPAIDPRALIERQVAVLTRLADMGMEIAEAATRAATAPAAPDPSEDAPFRGDPVLAYTRAARAVRQSFALQAQLLEDLAAVEKVEAKDRYDRNVRRRARVVDLVEEGLQVEHALGAREAGRLSESVRERLRDADEDERLFGLPFAEALARICADLQLSPQRTAQVLAAAAVSTAPAVIPDGPPGPIRDPGAAVAPGPLGPGSSLCYGRDDNRALSENDGGEAPGAALRERPPPPA